jgi:hypothetical protein
METQNKRYEVRTLIVGGGLTLREGQIVPADQLGEYAEWLKTEGAIVEVEERATAKHPVASRAYPG